MEPLLKSVRETKQVKTGLLSDYNPGVLAYIREHIHMDYDPVRILATSTQFNLKNTSGEYFQHIVNLKRVNDTRFINKFFEAVNANLDPGSLYIGCFESMGQRKERIFRRFSTLPAYLFYGLDFIWKRAFPKMSFTKKIYFGLTKGQNRVLSLPEVLGRLISCGFEIIDYRKIDNRTYFTVKKVRSPGFDLHPTYGPLISLNRVGYKGSIIKVRKFRTMHPYSEYLQEFIYRQNDLQEGGKFCDDFRITKWGAFLRKFWIDELPMLYNLLKGELKLVGVRPLSRQYFSLYPRPMRERRLKYKPGLVPPFYADLPETLDEIFASERKYMIAYEKHPILTDIRYLFRSVYNILIRKARSK